MNLVSGKTFRAIVVACCLVYSLVGCGGGGGNDDSISSIISSSYTLSGQITFAGSALSGVTVTLSGGASSSTTTDSSGNYSFTGLSNGSYTVTSSRTPYIFTPATVAIAGSDATRAFVATVVPGVSGGCYHSVTFTSDGNIWAWGYNHFGQLGNNSTTDSSSPVRVTTVSGDNLTGTIATAGGWFYSLAVKSDGTVWAWGYNVYGQLGNNSATESSAAVQVIKSDSSVLSGVTAVAAGQNHSLAVKSDGTVWAWGLNGSGQLGTNSTTTSYVAVQVINADSSAFTGVIAVAAGQYHSVALKSDGTVWAWGNNDNGRLGNNSPGTASYVPVQVIKSDSSALTGVIAVAAGFKHCLAVKSDGTVWAWGVNSSGQLGTKSTTDSSVAVQVINSDSSSFTGAIAVAAGQYHSVALKSGGTVWAWGSDEYGQLGDSDAVTPDTSVPVQVINSDSSALAGVIAIAAGQQHSLAAKSDGTVWAWGRNDYGQLGNNSTTRSLLPVEVSGF